MTSERNMRKIWFFVEGDSEEILITHLIRNKYYLSIKQEKDLINFVRLAPGSTGHHTVYCENCGSVDKIPHRINEMYYLVEKSRTRDVVVICDIEKLKCMSKRQDLIVSKLDPSVDKKSIRFAFFNPMIESAYWDCPRIIESVIKAEHKKKFRSPKTPSVSLPDKISSHWQDHLKKNFKKLNLKYRETSFAQQFFPRVDYANCPNQVLTRICSFLDKDLKK